ncbi:peptidase M56 [Paenibacillus jilunlii]|nr:peptidase M56 [Paenibacillus jilunlii]
MITRFKRGSYKLSAVAILLIVALGAILLTHASTTGNGTQSDVSPQATNSKEETASSFRIVRPIDSFKWFNNLGRALDFSKFSFKVPDYLPEGYEFQDVEWNKNFSDPNQTDLLDFVSMTYVSHFGSEQEQIIEMLASKGKGSMLEHNLLRGASYSQETIQAPSYRQDAVTIGNVKGVVFTNMQANRHKPGTAKSFVWQDDGVWYAINYYDGNDISEEEIPYYRGKISQEELVKIVQSYTFPQKVQHIRYDGEGNSFPLYDQSDLLKAKNILGFKVKFPLKLPDTTLTLFDSILLRANDQNTGYSFRQSADTLWNTYRAPHDSQIYELNDEVYLYQNKTPLFDAAKLSPVRKLEMNGIEVSAYNDPNHVYYGPIHSDEDKLKLKSQTFYLWQHDSIYYAAVFLGMDQNQEKILEALVTAPSQ